MNAEIATARYMSDFVSAAIEETREFVERALVDFGLIEEFQSRTEAEREACLGWIGAAHGERNEEDRVSRVLDALFYGRRLPGSGAWSA